MRSLILLSAVLAAAPAVFADDHGLFARQGATSTQADRKKVDPSIVQILSGPEQNQRLASGTSKLSGDGAGSFCQTTSGLSGICMASKRCVRSGGKPEAGAVMGDPAAGAPTYCEGQTCCQFEEVSCLRGYGKCTHTSKCEKEGRTSVPEYCLSVESTDIQCCIDTEDKEEALDDEGTPSPGSSTERSETNGADKTSQAGVDTAKKPISDTSRSGATQRKVNEGSETTAGTTTNLGTDTKSATGTTGDSCVAGQVLETSLKQRLMKLEGFSATPAASNNRLVIGYGHSCKVAGCTDVISTAGKALSKEDADKLLVTDIKTAATCVTEQLNQQESRDPLNANQLLALATSAHLLGCRQFALKTVESCFKTKDAASCRQATIAFPAAANLLSTEAQLYRVASSQQAWPCAQ